ncbi:hypothetical protein [Ornithinibacter sp.]|uniref:hypothetical protein n=1 Tax=Ornithinibacter sp. TaxID=2862748 RepID=UPI002C08914F|nr:hypothetical protein [Ornithinibacter sp.]HRA27769.1 hypothetical protein [Ornithinibacter sp.]
MDGDHPGGGRGCTQTAATQQTIIDSQRWLQWVNAVDAGQKARADFLDNTML